MSKSLYERYAEEAQPGALSKTISLEAAAESIKSFKGHFSKEYVEWAEEICAAMFGRTFEEVRDLVDGKSHWISIVGMYEENVEGSISPEFLCRGEVYLPLGYSGLEERSFFELSNDGKRFLEARLSAHSDFHDVSVECTGKYVTGCIFMFSCSTQLSSDSIQRILSGMFYGLKHSFYIDHNLDDKLANAVDRSGGLKDNNRERDLELI